MDVNEHRAFKKFHGKIYKPLFLIIETNLTCIFNELADLDLASVV